MFTEMKRSYMMPQKHEFVNTSHSGNTVLNDLVMRMSGKSDMYDKVNQ
jgi:hypothetical protein